MKIKLQSVLTFCGLTTIAAVYYCYYIVSNKKRKQKQIDLTNLSQKSDQDKTDLKNWKPEQGSNLQNKEEELNCEESLVIAKDCPIVNNSINNCESCDLPANLVSDNSNTSSHNSFITTVTDKEDIVVQEETLSIEPFVNRICESTPLKLDSLVASSEIEKMCDETNVVQTASPQIAETQSKVPTEVMVESQEIIAPEIETPKSSPKTQEALADESNLSWASIVEETLKEHSVDSTFCPVSENSVYYVNPKSPIKSSPNKPQKPITTDSNRKTAPLTQKNSAKGSPKSGSQTSQTAIKTKTQSVQKQPQVFHTSQYEKRINNSEQNQNNNNSSSKQSNRQKSSSKSANNNSKNSSYKENNSKKLQDQSILLPCNGAHFNNDNVSDCSSNQENDPDAKQNSSLSKKSSSKKSSPSGTKATVNGDYVANGCMADGAGYEQQVEQMGAMIDQIYLNDPSVISIISPTNFSDPDSAVISCGESSLTSITYLHNGIPSPSETSTDSGMMRSSGSPEYFNPPLEEFLSWEVEIPTHVGGKIIGKAGRNVKELRDKTGCKVIIKDIENSRRKQLLVVRGTLEQIKVCHRLLEKKFRKDIEFETGLYYTMEGLAGFLGYPMTPQMSHLAAAAVAASNPVAAAAASTAPPTQILPAANTYLQLPQSAYFDVIVCSIKTAGHFFLQQPTHNSFFNLDRLHDCMRDCYSKPSVPELPYPIALGTISAAYLDGKWCRSQVVAVTDDENVITVRFLDMGGYREMPRHSVKQIRTDFLSLPFQATEVFLSEVTPANDEPDFSPEATKFLEELIAQSGTPQAFLKGWNMSDMPLVDLIVRRDGKFESVAQLLIDHGYAVRLEIATV